MTVMTLAPQPAVVPSHPHQDVLDIVNALREEWGKPTIAELPKGQPCAAHACVIARALDVHAVVPHCTGPYYRLAMSGPTLPLPRVLADFALSFDLGGYPELVECDG